MNIDQLSALAREVTIRELTNHTGWCTDEDYQVDRADARASLYQAAHAYIAENEAPAIRGALIGLDDRAEFSGLLYSIALEARWLSTEQIKRANGLLDPALS